MMRAHTRYLFILCLVLSCEAERKDSLKESEESPDKSEIQAIEKLTPKQFESSIKPISKEPDFEKLEDKQARLLQLYKEALEENPVNFSDTINFEGEDWWPFCREYWRQLSAVRKLSLDYFNLFVLEPSKKDSGISQKNKAFINRLAKELNSSVEKHAERYAPESIIFAIVHLSNGPSGTYSTQHHLKVKNNYQVIDKDRLLVKKYENSQEWTFEQENNIPIRFNEGVLDTISVFQNSKFYGYSESIKTDINLTAFGTTTSECETEYFYQVSNRENLTKHLKMGSMLDFDLEAYRDERIDQQININRCGDCPSSNFNVFAKLAGSDHLYFAYASSGETPGLMLILRVEETFIPILVNTTDQFGCACL
ncbi:MAG: hypothetical protein VYB44_17195 [Bacteroidota bacterium]|nr:hypothetical protein [Bacteroidota bacterium]